MAIEEIVSAIDEYIARLWAARDMIVSLRNQPEVSQRKPVKRKSRRKRDSLGVPVPPPTAKEVAVQIIPPRVPRQQRRHAKPALPSFSPLGGPIPKGPVVIPPSDLARMRSPSNQVHPTVQGQKSTPSGGTLEELAREVAKRLASGRGFPN